MLPAPTSSAGRNQDPRHILVTTPGAWDVLVERRSNVSALTVDHAVVRNTAAGVNFIDIYHRKGFYPRELPFVPGVEGVGIIEAIGPGDSHGLAVGDRVGYIGPFGSYATHTADRLDRLIPLPEHVLELTAAAVLLRGITAHALLHRVHQVRPGETILVHAAAGGLGLLMCQWAASLGATVIGTVSTPAKADLARRHGCHHPLVYDADWPGQVKAITGGRGVPVVYDSIGRDTVERGLDCLSVLGTMVYLGQSSGPPEPFDVTALGPRGSPTVTRPSVFHFIRSRADPLAAADAVFTALRQGHIAGEPGHTYRLAHARHAHKDLDQRKTTGSVVLLP